MQSVHSAVLKVFFLLFLLLFFLLLVLLLLALPDTYKGWLKIDLLIDKTELQTTKTLSFAWSLLVITSMRKRLTLKSRELTCDLFSCTASDPYRCRFGFGRRLISRASVSRAVQLKILDELDTANMWVAFHFRTGHEIWHLETCACKLVGCCWLTAAMANIASTYNDSCYHT